MGHANVSTASRRRRRRAKQHQPASVKDTGLRDATVKLAHAITALTYPQPPPQPHTKPLPCRYTTLRQALYTHRGGNGNNPKAHTIPAWIDALKYVIEIDGLACDLHQRWPAPQTNQQQHVTIRRLNAILAHNWLAADNVQQIRDATTQLGAYADKIDDLFAAQPVYLPDPCPHCGHTHTRKLNDLGETVSTPALAVSVDKGAWCQQCHDKFAPLFLGRLLGYQPIPGVLDVC